MGNTGRCDEENADPAEFLELRGNGWVMELPTARVKRSVYRAVAHEYHKAATPAKKPTHKRFTELSGT
jgi:hypothetical protein